MARLVPHFPGSKDLKCFAHTLTHVGEETKLPNLKVVKEKLFGMMNAGEESDTFTKCGEIASDHHGATLRWWATFELYEFLYENWDSFLLFINNCHEDNNVENGVRLLSLKEIVVDL